MAIVPPGARGLRGGGRGAPSGAGDARARTGAGGGGGPDRARALDRQPRVGDPVSPGPHPDTVALVLAAGQGTRMQSDLAKVLHPMAGEPLLAHVLRALDEVGVARVLVVIGHQRDRVQAAFPDARVEW